MKRNAITAKEHECDNSIFNQNEFMRSYMTGNDGLYVEEVTEFAVTREEMIELAKFWVKIFWSVECLCLQWGHGKREISFRRYARRRIKQIAKLLGKELTNQIIKQTSRECLKRINPVQLRPNIERDIIFQKKLSSLTN
jgi:hypothetical protein